MFLRSLFGQTKREFENPEFTEEYKPLPDTGRAVLPVSDELTSDVEDYFWEQVGMFGGTSFRDVPVNSGGRRYTADCVVSLPHNLYVITCRKCEGELHYGDNVYADWSVTVDNEGTLPVTSPVVENSECVKGLCNSLNMSPQRVISEIVFTDATRLRNPMIRVSRLRIERYSELRANGIWDTGGILLDGTALTEIENQLREAAWSTNPSPKGLIYSHPEWTPREMGIPVCPICGHPLKLANTTKGTYATCTAYPVCTFTRRICR